MNERAKWLILIGLVVLIVTALDVNLILAPLWDELGRVNRELTSIRGRVEQGERDVRQLPAHRQQLERMREESKGLLAKLPSRHRIAEVLERLSEYAAKAGVRLESVRPIEQEGVPPADAAAPSSPTGKRARPETVTFEPYPIHVVAQSGYHELAAFINQIEREEPAIVIQELTMAGEEASPTAHHIELTVHLLVPP